MLDGHQRVYERFEDIPDEIDLVIDFNPECPPPPHTDEQHRDLEQWPAKLAELMRRERASRSQSR